VPKRLEAGAAAECGYSTTSSVPANVTLGFNIDTIDELKLMVSPFIERQWRECERSLCDIVHYALGFCAEMMAISLVLTHDWLQAAIFAD
jgi:hypothetical protein